MWIGVNNDQIGLLRPDEWIWAMFKPTSNWTIFTFDQFFMWIWQIMSRYNGTWPNYTFDQLFIWIETWYDFKNAIGHLKSMYYLVVFKVVDFYDKILGSGSFVD